MRSLARSLRRLLLRVLAPPVRLPTGPIPAAWHDILVRKVPLAAHLAPGDRDRLLRIMQLFLQEVPIEGCLGLEVTEEMRVTIAAQAALLLVRLPYPRYPRVRRVLVYPSAFVPTTVALHATGQVVRPGVPGQPAWPGSRRMPQPSPRAPGRAHSLSHGRSPTSMPSGVTVSGPWTG